MNALTGPRVSALRLAVLPVWLMSCLLSPAQQPAPPEKPVPVSRHAVVPDKELLITCCEVTESAEAQYPGSLSFGYVMEQLAGKPNASQFTLDWLRLWLRDQEVNRDTAPARPQMEAILETWRHKDQEGGPDDALGWTPNLAHAPFKLIAVVNRMDLLAPVIVEQIRAARENAMRDLAFLRGDLLARAVPLKNKEFTELGELFHRSSPEVPQPPAGVPVGSFPVTGRVRPEASPQRTEFVTLSDDTGGAGFAGGGYGGSSSPFLSGQPNGEGRLVFVLTDTEGRPVEPGFNVIFEYHLLGPLQTAGSTPPSTPPAITWAARWHHLGTHEAFDAAYIEELVALTKSFTDQRPPRDSSEHHSPPSLSRIRTNDGVLDPVREFREFKMVHGTQPLDSTTAVAARIRQVPVGLTPAERYREAPAPERILATVLNSRVENFRKEAPLTLPVAVLLKNETEPDGVLGARSLLPGAPIDFSWKVTGVREKNLVRHFSLNTCNGCHGGDTRNDNGLHLKATVNGTFASAFLAPGADDRPSAEMRDRAAILKALLETGERDSDAALVRLLHKRHRSTH